MTPKLPSNLIVSKYTSGKQYMYVDTYKEYIGYYYEFAGKKYVGKEFNVNAPELIEISSSKISPLINNPSTFVYGILSGINLPQNIVSSLPYNDSDEVPPKENPNEPYTLPSFYCRKINEKDIKIKEIDEKTYKSLQQNPLYQTTYIGLYNNKTQFLEDAEKQLPGLTLFLS